MAQTFALSTTAGPASDGVVPIGCPGADIAGTIIAQVVIPSACNITPKLVLADTALTAQSATYTNLATGAVVAAGTAITVAGIYAIYAPGCDVQFLVNSGSGTVSVNTVFGRV